MRSHHSSAGDVSPCPPYLGARRRLNRFNRCVLYLEFLEARNLLAGSWTSLSNSGIPSTRSLDHLVLLSNGWVLGHTTVNQSPDTRSESVCATTMDCSGTEWYVLVPDQYGKYDNSTWSHTFPGSSNIVASEQQTRGVFSSQLLPDGRLLVVGGEIFQNGTLACLHDLTGYYTSGDDVEIYDPTSKP